MVGAMSMDEILKESGIERTLYVIGNIRLFSSKVSSLVPPQDLDEAIKEASEDLQMRGDEDRVQVFIPCNIDDLITPTKFGELLLDANKYEIRLGERSPKMAYGRRNDAFLGKTDSSKSHRGFMVYDSAEALVVDLINRDGNSILDKRIRADYNSFLEKRLGYSIAWRERSLCDISG